MMYNFLTQWPLIIFQHVSSTCRLIINLLLLLIFCKTLRTNPGVSQGLESKGQNVCSWTAININCDLHRVAPRGSCCWRLFHPYLAPVTSTPTISCPFRERISSFRRTLPHFPAGLFFFKSVTQMHPTSSTGPLGAFLFFPPRRFSP